MKKSKLMKASVLVGLAMALTVGLTQSESPRRVNQVVGVRGEAVPPGQPSRGVTVTGAAAAGVLTQTRVSPSHAFSRVTSNQTSARSAVSGMNLMAQAQPGDTDARDNSRAEKEADLDDQFNEVAKRVPGFGGMFFAEDGTLNVYYVDNDEPLTSERMAALHEAINEFVVETSSDSIRIITGTYRFSQLYTWHDEIRGSVLEIPGVVMTDVDDAKNRLHIGIQSLAAENLVVQRLAALGVPRDAVEIDLADPIEFHSLQDFHRPLVGGQQIAFGNSVCTLGFPAVRGRTLGFVTNSHCTSTRGAVEGTQIHQPIVYSAATMIGQEVIDPRHFTGGPCPFGRRCRYSDAAFIGSYNTSGYSVKPAVGYIAAPYWGTLDWNETTHFKIKRETPQPIVGAWVHKVGRTTGGTSGYVTRTCATVNVSNSDVTLLCQSQATYYNQPGDSGSPVFGLLSSFGAQLYGINWGGDGTTSMFSPMRNIQLKSELGALKTCASPKC